METEKYEKELVKDNEFKAKKSYLRKQDPYANTVRSLHRAFIFDEEEQKIKHYSIAKKKVLLPTTEEKEIEMCCSFHPVTDRKSNKLCEKVGGLYIYIYILLSKVKGYMGGKWKTDC